MLQLILQFIAEKFNKVMKQFINLNKNLQGKYV